MYVERATTKRGRVAQSNHKEGEGCPVYQLTSPPQDFEVEAIGTHLMRVLVCSKSLLKEEICGHGKIRVSQGDPCPAMCITFPKSLILHSYHFMSPPTPTPTHTPITVTCQ